MWAGKINIVDTVTVNREEGGLISKLNSLVEVVGSKCPVGVTLLMLLLHNTGRQVNKNPNTKAHNELYNTT